MAVQGLSPQLHATFASFLCSLDTCSPAFDDYRRWQYPRAESQMLVTTDPIGPPVWLRPPLPGYVRSESLLRASFGAVDGRTSIRDLHEAGALRLRFPRTGGGSEAIILNTSGGIAGGDLQDLIFRLGPDARAAITTQSAEKVYRSDGATATIAARLAVDDGAELAWLPQEAILFDGARLKRSLDVDIAPNARLTIKEGVVFGRTAMGEDMKRGLFRDRWRVRRDGRLIHAEDVALDDDIAATLARPAVGAVRAIATILHAAPDANDHLESVRATLACPGCAAGASAWNGMLAVRLAGADPRAVRLASAAVLHVLLPTVSPRIWAC